MTQVIIVDLSTGLIYLEDLDWAFDRTPSLSQLPTPANPPHPDASRGFIEAQPLPAAPWDTRVEIYGRRKQYQGTLKLQHAGGGLTWKRLWGIRKVKEVWVYERAPVRSKKAKELDIQAFGLLSASLVSGTSQSNVGRPVPAFVPTTQQISLAATLVVHPSHTTRAPPEEANRAANDALRLLRQVNKLVGPVNANFANALAFSSSGTGRLRDWRRTTKKASISPLHESEGAINTDIANAGSIWQRAEDFWHVVGWAFNCSVIWKKRWERWQLWLHFMLDALNDDFDERLMQAQDLEDGLEAQNLIRESLIVQYLLTCDTRTARRRVMRAIFADGDTKATNEFTEIFKNETKERKPKGKDGTKFKNKKKLNIDEGEFADYVSEDENDDEAMEDAQPDSSQPLLDENAGRRASTASIGYSPDESEHDNDETMQGVDRFGGLEAVLLRQRTLALLAKVSSTTSAYPAPIDDLLDLFTEFLRPLPLPLFSMFTSAPSPYLDSRIQSSLNRTLLRPLLGNSYTGSDTNELTQEQVENDYLPCGANSTAVTDNARVSLLVESLLRMLLQDGHLQLTTSLQRAVLWGIEARQANAEWDGRKRSEERRKEEQWSQTVLELSAARMQGILETLGAGQLPQIASKH
ncbi:MAG: hypothetical protein M1820_008735 [Bogoriella megaspora]|nr:MAG: hypothetical protein M1820_008735 [Bogoriella megaspora]